MMSTNPLAQWREASLSSHWQTIPVKGPKGAKSNFGNPREGGKTRLVLSAYGGRAVSWRRSGDRVPSFSMMRKQKARKLVPILTRRRRLSLMERKAGQGCKLRYEEEN